MDERYERVEINRRTGFILPPYPREQWVHVLGFMGIVASAALLGLGIYIGICVTIKNSWIPALVCITAGVAICFGSLFTALQTHIEVWVDAESVRFVNRIRFLRSTQRYKRRKVTSISMFSFATMLAEMRDSGQMAGKAGFDPKKYKDAHILLGLTNGHIKEVLDYGYSTELITRLAEELRNVCGVESAELPKALP